MKMIGKFSVSMLALMFVLASAYIARAGEAKDTQMGLGAGKEVSTAPAGPSVKAPGPYKYNYNARHGVTNDFGQDKTGNHTF